MHWFLRHIVSRLVLKREALREEEQRRCELERHSEGSKQRNRVELITPTSKAKMAFESTKDVNEVLTEGEGGNLLVSPNFSEYEFPLKRCLICLGHSTSNVQQPREHPTPGNT
jgi:hypothetical protein